MIPVDNKPMTVPSTPGGQTHGRAKVIDARPRLEAARGPSRADARAPRARSRVLLYSHDTMGLGHLRRNLLLAKALTGPALDADVLLVTGATEVGRFTLPPGTECLVLPAYSKDLEGGYHARRMRMALGELVDLRSQLIRGAVAAFDPDLVVVDNVARGVNGELDRMLRLLRARDGVRCVLGLRDVRDEPRAVRRDWLRDRFEQTVADLYDEVWVYGDPRVYDLRQEYEVSAQLAAKIRFTGYLDQRRRLDDPNAAAPAAGAERQRLGLCLVGGGQDGDALAHAFAQAELPPGMRALLVTGPFMKDGARKRLEQLVRSRTDMEITDFVPEPTALIRDASFVVSMGGYNTVCELLSFGTPGLIVPRVAPRREQLIRAERLQHLGALDMLHPAELSPEALGAWIVAHAESARAPHSIDLGGLDRVEQFAAAALHTGAALSRQRMWQA